MKDISYVLNDVVIVVIIYDAMLCCLAACMWQLVVCNFI